MRAASTMTYVEQWQWLLAMRRSGSTHSAPAKPSSVPSHGQYGYQMYGCRCDLCRDGAYRSQRQRYAKQLEASHANKMQRWEDAPRQYGEDFK